MHTDDHPPQAAACAIIRRTGLAVIALGAI